LAILLTEGCAGRVHPAAPVAKAPSAPVQTFTATAYCQGTRTAAGTRPVEKTVAADPAVLPLGSHVRVSGLDKRYNGVYTVLDTGPKVRGRRIDLYMRDCREAVRFGRQKASLALLRD
jgi:3D (Asp-Asp-Asp) domain-containing protein